MRLHLPVSLFLAFVALGAEVFVLAATSSADVVPWRGGKLTMNGANTYVGGTTLNDGTLRATAGGLYAFTDTSVSYSVETETRSTSHTRNISVRKMS